MFLTRTLRRPAVQGKHGKIKIPEGRFHTLPNFLMDDPTLKESFRDLPIDVLGKIKDLQDEVLGYWKADPIRKALGGQPAMVIDLDFYAKWMTPESLQQFKTEVEEQKREIEEVSKEDPNEQTIVQQFADTVQYPKEAKIFEDALKEQLVGLDLQLKQVAAEMKGLFTKSKEQLLLEHPDIEMISKDGFINRRFQEKYETVDSYLEGLQLSGADKILPKEHSLIDTLVAAKMLPATNFRHEYTNEEQLLPIETPNMAETLQRLEVRSPQLRKDIEEGLRAIGAFDEKFQNDLK